MWNICLLLSLLLAACAGSSGGDTREISLISGVLERIIHVEIADTPEERARGLMGRTELCDDCGMLFVFDELRPLAFWMKNTLIPLDVFFFDGEGGFVGVQTMEPCLPAEAPLRGANDGADDPCPTYASGLPAKYALEVNAGVIEKGNWKLKLTKR